MANRRSSELRRAGSWPHSEDRALLCGKSVFLRLPRAEDRGEYLAAGRRSKKLHHPWGRPATTAAEFAKYSETILSDTSLRTLVCRREDGAIAGFVNYNVITRGALHSAYLGYGVFEPHAGRGVMTEALGLALRHGFGSLKLHRLEANIQPGNENSIRVVKRAGFRLEGFSPRYLKINGRWRDHERWAILKEEWRRQ